MADRPIDRTQENHIDTPSATGEARFHWLASCPAARPAVTHVTPARPLTQEPTSKHKANGIIVKHTNERYRQVDALA